MICEVVEGAGGHIGVASCATHTCSAAIEHSHFQKKKFTICELERPLHIDVCNDFLDFLGILWATTSTYILAVPRAEIGGVATLFYCNARSGPDGQRFKITDRS
jgi:hypothetical protein